MDYQSVITIEAGERSGQPSVRHTRIAVADVLGWLAAAACLKIYSFDL